MAYWKFQSVRDMCYSWEWWVKYIGNKTKITLSPNTYVEKHSSGLIFFYLHDNNILILNNLNYWQISSCGRETPTTKKRINQLSPIDIYQRNWEWFYKDENGVSQPFKDDIIVDCNCRKYESLC